MTKFQFLLAPMEGIATNSFRAMCYRYGADLTFTEMTRIDGLARNNKSTVSKIELRDDTPTVIQVFGAKESYFTKFLQNFKPSHGFMGFNLNIGCPTESLVKIGQGCAMIRRITKVQNIVSLFKKQGYNISVKLRLGNSEYDKDKKVYLNLIKGVNADSFIVHARHGQETYADMADFSIYKDCVATGKAIIGNGDINNHKHIKFLKKIGVKGAMIGRAAISNPAIFLKLRGLSFPLRESLEEEYLELSKKYNESEKTRQKVINFNKQSIKPQF